MEDFLNVQEYYQEIGEYVHNIFATRHKLVSHRKVFERHNRDSMKAVNFIDYYLTKKAEEIQAKKVLDVGAGCGETLVSISLNTTQRRDEFYRETDYQYFGISASLLEVHIANNICFGRHVNNCRLFTADFHDPSNFKFFQNSDLAFAVESLSCSYDLHKVISNVATSLKDGAQFVVFDVFFNKKIDPTYHKKYPISLLYKTQMDEESLLDPCRKNNLVLQDIEDFSQLQGINNFAYLNPMIPFHLKGLFNKTLGAQKYVSKMIQKGEARYLCLTFKKMLTHQPK